MEGCLPQKSPTSLTMLGIFVKILNLSVHPVGIEPTSPRHKRGILPLEKKGACAHRGARTHDHTVKSRTLYQLS